MKIRECDMKQYEQIIEKRYDSLDALTRATFIDSERRKNFEQLCKNLEGASSEISFSPEGIYLTSVCCYKGEDKLNTFKKKNFKKACRNWADSLNEFPQMQHVGLVFAWGKKKARLEMFLPWYQSVGDVPVIMALFENLPWYYHYQRKPYKKLKSKQ